MHLKRIEVHGFKSFADKTEIEFGRGITAIVGPNGSGKSNIADAVLWVLGEQSLRALRSNRAEDVIFAGSDRRRATGMAEVTLIFDNSDQVLPVEYNEVAITRRLYRSGDNEYLINRNHCRLRDITELLSPTGLGRASMTVLGQSRLDEVLNSRPEDRRLIFEDAAGISVYKQRKRDALRKMDDARANLECLTDVICELEQTLEPLKQSADKALLAQRLSARLAELRRRQLRWEISQLHERRGQVRAEVRRATVELAELTGQMVELEKQCELTEQEQSGIDEQLRRAEHEWRQHGLTVEKIAGNIAVLNEKIVQLDERIVRNDKVRTSLAGERDEAEQEAERNRNLAVVAGQKAAGLEREIGETIAGQQAKAAQVQEIEARIEELRGAFFSQIQENVTQRNLMNGLAERIEDLERRCRDGRAELAAIDARSDKMGKEGAELEEKIAGRRNDRHQLSLARAEAESERGRQIQMRQSLMDAERDLAGRLQAMRSRHQLLQNLQNDYEGVGRGVRMVMKADRPWRKGVLGLVGQIIRVPDSLLTAIETALGGAAQNIVTSDSLTARQAIDYLRDQDGGRATFMPLDHVQKVSRPDRRIWQGMEGIAGIAADMVDYDEQFAGIVENLLARTVVAKDMDWAMRLTRASNFSLRVVTLTGELFNPGGAISGGSIRRKDSGIIGRASEIKTLSVQIDECERELDRLQHKIGCVTGELQRQEETLAGLMTGEKTIDVELAELNLAAKTLTRDHQLLLQSRQVLAGEIVEMCDTLNKCRQEWLAVKKEVDRQQTDDEQARRQVGVWQHHLEEARREMIEISGQRERLAVTLATWQQKKISYEEEARRWQQQLLTIDDKLEQLAGENRQNAVRREEITAEISQRQAELDRQRRGEDDAGRRRDELLDERQAVTARCQKLARELRKIRGMVEAGQKVLQERKIAEAEIECQIQDKNLRWQEEFGQKDDDETGPDTVEPLTEDEQHEISQLGLQLENIGPFNPLAPAEYENALRRAEFLGRQRDDLIQTSEKLGKVIDEIDQTMTARLLEAFSAINENFQTMFSALFGGGRAGLRMHGEDGVLQAGAEITAQPPGKKLQNLSLLSGGERALTVTALLLAILRYRPAPFCVVDEIDAALDEVNARKFADLLREFSAGTQFLVVTHRKSTMEAADIMHGVTLAEAGVSKLLSVDFAA
ncbi:MAG: chromosome segregation protein SMC [Negativicutes bacterium]|nr:chromosome segregation protein SMC [Negativicutes bacterium]